MENVEFTVRVSDLRNAMQLLGVNRRGNVSNDFADLLVSECVATFRSVGTSTEVPVNGTSPGAARIPLQTLQKAAGIVPTFQKTEVTLAVETGTLKIGSWRCKHEEITVGVIPDQKIDLAVDASVLDTLALARILTAKQIEEQGLTKRVDRARRVLRAAIANAVHHLSCIEATPEQVEQIARVQIENAAQKLEKSFAARQS